MTEIRINKLENRMENHVLKSNNNLHSKSLRNLLRTSRTQIKNATTVKPDFCLKPIESFRFNSLNNQDY